MDITGGRVWGALAERRLRRGEGRCVGETASVVPGAGELFGRCGTQRMPPVSAAT
jgi:hypothetical protein